MTATESPDEAVSLRVPFTAPSASVVRQQLRTWLADRGYSGETMEDARVVISELVGNSVRHAGPLPRNDLQVEWHLEERELVICVSDGGGTATTPRVVDAAQDAIAGRGLNIVAALAKKWWVEDQPGNTTVHVRIPLA